MKWMLSLRFNGHFPGEPGLAGVYWSKGWWRWWWLLELLAVQSSSQIITTNKPTSSFFTGRMPFLSPNQQCQSTEGKPRNGYNQYYFALDSTFPRPGLQDWGQAEATCLGWGQHSGLETLTSLCLRLPRLFVNFLTHSWAYSHFFVHCQEFWNKQSPYI